jgi:hypothetical protein
VNKTDGKWIWYSFNQISLASLFIVRSGPAGCGLLAYLAGDQTRATIKGRHALVINGYRIAARKQIASASIQAYEIHP